MQRRDRQDTHHLGFRRDEEGVLAEEKHLHSLDRGGHFPSLEVRQKLFHWHGRHRVAEEVLVWNLQRHLQRGDEIRKPPHRQASIMSPFSVCPRSEIFILNLSKKSKRTESRVKTRRLFVSGAVGSHIKAREE